MKLLNIEDVCEKTTLSKSEIYRRMEGSTFPKPVRVGPKRIAWFEDEIDQWIEALRAERDEQTIK